MTMKHLSADEMDAVLIGDASAAAQEHVEGCAACAGEVHAMRASLVDFRLAAVQAARREQAVAQRQDVAVRRWWTMPALVGAPVCALLAIGVAVMPRQGERQGERQVLRPQVAVATPLNTISDEKLMQDIQQDLAVAVPDAMLPLATDSGATGQTTATPSRNN